MLTYSNGNSFSGAGAPEQGTERVLPSIWARSLTVVSVEPAHRSM
jgi:hypothetical protein